MGVESLIKALKADPEDSLLMDPLMLQPLQDPIVLSSGFILDRTCACDDDGQLRFRLCPFTREPLHRNVYPVLALRNRVQEWRLERLREAERIAVQLITEEIDASNVLDIARELLSGLQQSRDYE